MTSGASIWPQEPQNDLKNLKWPQEVKNLKVNDLKNIQMTWKTSRIFIWPLDLQLPPITKVTSKVALLALIDLKYCYQCSVNFKGWQDWKVKVSMSLKGMHNNRCHVCKKLHLMLMYVLWSNHFWKKRTSPLLYCQRHEKWLAQLKWRS